MLFGGLFVEFFPVEKGRFLGGEAANGFLVEVGVPGDRLGHRLHLKQGAVVEIIGLIHHVFRQT